MIDRSFGDYGQMLRSPDLRLHGVETVVFRTVAPFRHSIADPRRAYLVSALSGDFILSVEGSSRGAIAIAAGTTAGFESGRAHHWEAMGKRGSPVELFVSSIDRKMGVLQRLDQGLILVPPDAEPHAGLIRQAIALHIAAYKRRETETDDAIVCRCAEIVMIELVRFVRARTAQQPDAPTGLAHDSHLLRAWSAFFANPQRRWTVQSLADAAGLGRTAFAVRFRTVFGAPPLQTLTALRLEQAETLLRQSQAPLIEIAFTAGYSSEAAFVRAFDRKYGMTPGRFRTAHAPP